MQGVVSEDPAGLALPRDAGQRHTLIAYTGGKMRKHHIRILAGDDASRWSCRPTISPRAASPSAISSAALRAASALAERYSLRFGEHHRDWRVAPALAKRQRRASSPGLSFSSALSMIVGVVDGLVV